MFVGGNGFVERRSRDRWKKVGNGVNAFLIVVVIVSVIVAVADSQ